MPSTDTGAPTVKLQTGPAAATRAPAPAGGMAVPMAPAAKGDALSPVDVILAAVAMVCTVGAAVVLFI